MPMQAVPEFTYNILMDAYLVPCSEVPSLPSLTFVLGGVPFSVPATEWVVEVSFLSHHKSLHERNVYIRHCQTVISILIVRALSEAQSEVEFQQP